MDNVQDHLEYEKALTFLVENLQKSGNNPKPVGIHSVLVATRLYRYGYKRSIVLAALLHDVVEDTAVTLKDVRKEFGEEVAKLVQGMTWDTKELSIKNKHSVFEKHMKEMLNLEQGVLAIAASDLIENSYFFKRGDNEELLRYLKYKYEVFLKKAKPFLANSPLWPELKGAYKENVKKL